MDDGFRVQVLLQGEDDNTCVACATVNALRHFGRDAPTEEVVESLRVRRFGERGGSFVIKAAKYLARQHNLITVCSRPPFLIRHPVKAAAETAARFELLLNQGFVGLIHRRETRRMGHAVVLTGVLWRDDQPLFVTYDSNKRHARGHWVYRALDYVNLLDSEELSIDAWLGLPADRQAQFRLTPTGRTAWFVRPRQITRVNTQPGG